MAKYPGVERDIRVPHGLLRDSVATIFQACDMREDDALLLADSLVHADLRGIHSHGVLRVPDYVRKLTTDGVDPKGTPVLVTDAAAALVVDGGNAMGQVGMAFAMDRAISRAKEVNVAFAAIRGSNHAGAMDYFACRALPHDMIGICGTNALPTMSPWGGKDKIVGINPIGIALPGGREGPFVLDIAFGQTAHGKIRVYAQKGEPIPEGWAFDADGLPTTDADAALEGLIQPIGGHKGVGLGMAVGMLSTLLSGAAYGTGLGNMVDGPTAGLDGHFAIAINIAAFTEVQAFKAHVDTILQQARDGGRVAGVERLYSPGEIEADFEYAYRADGIPLNDKTLDDLFREAAVLGADVASLAAHLKIARQSRG